MILEHGILQFEDQSVQNLKEEFIMENYHYLLNIPLNHLLYIFSHIMDDFKLMKKYA